MKWSEIEHIVNFTKPVVTNASLKGHSVTNIKENAYRLHMDGMHGYDGRKLGPRDIGFSEELASEIAGIKPMKYSEIDWTENVGFDKPKITKSSMQGFSTIQVKEAEGSYRVVGADGRAPGPRQIMEMSSQARLASVRAGIKPMKYSEQEWDADFTKSKITKSSLQGFAAVVPQDYGGHGITNEAGRKLGPRDVGRSAKLASERAGIKPMKYSQMDRDDMIIDFKKAFKPTKSSLRGFTSTKIKEGGSGYSGTDKYGRKLGPREIGRATAKLASEQEEQPIIPIDATYTIGLGTGTKSSLKGLSTTRLKDEGGYANQSAQTDGYGRKLGPREIGRASGRLASEKDDKKTGKFFIKKEGDGASKTGIT